MYCHVSRCWNMSTDLSTFWLTLGHIQGSIEMLTESRNPWTCSRSYWHVLDPWIYARIHENIIRHIGICSAFSFDLSLPFGGLLVNQESTQVVLVARLFVNYLGGWSKPFGPTPFPLLFGSSANKWYGSHVQELAGRSPATQMESRLWP